jgi:hypothetical protein
VEIVAEGNDELMEEFLKKELFLRNLGPGLPRQFRTPPFLY